MKQHKHLSLALTTLSTLTLAVMTLTGAAVAQGTSIMHGPRLHGQLKNGTSTNWAGYGVETNLTTPANNAVSDVSGSWVVSTVTCPNRSNNYSSSWVGIDGYSDNTVEQAGTEQDCQRGRAQYYAWYEFYPQAELPVSNLSVHPGDTMSGDVKAVGSSVFAVTLTNQTTHRSFTTSRRMNAALRQSAEWIAEAPSSFFGAELPLANFGSVSFSNASATINGHIGTMTDPAWQSDPLTMVTSKGQPKASLSGPSADGSSFSVFWQHN